MPDQEPFIIPSSDPFKVEATPAKFGGVDARAKRPLDMSGQAVSLSDHLEPVGEAAATPPNTVLLSDASPDPGAAVWDAAPEPPLSPGPRVPLPPSGPIRDSQVLLPEGGHRTQGADGPVVQDALDTQHREQFDDPSRFLRTDTKVRLPSAEPLQRHQAVPTLPTGTPARILMPTGTPVEVALDSHASRAPGRAMRPVAPAGTPAGPLRPEGAPLAGVPAAPSTTGGTPEQRRQSFHQRLTQILSDQQQIAQELNAVEQAAQITRAQIHDPPSDEPPPSD